MNIREILMLWCVKEEHGSANGPDEERVRIDEMQKWKEMFSALN